LKKIEKLTVAVAAAVVEVVERFLFHYLIKNLT
jgi:hypothetical protein